ncbi:MAG: cell division protein FtsZ [Gammaproteobacteria bacterium]|nr:cell division protein FtsZ [Gammaproteobacteria bacterium]MDE0509507.1 cell division protein FtsZ [Gammaproteobacteria bacterium]MXX05836.1 cell division protein FtsZ [Gammaproteobacteria bacterium]MXY91385.1 cell division protein FtsZ [Gammaproteobacteria bacterium]MYA36802.1 cell division protein FtsZ [Gammaproteobacteria bacterium]
MAERTETFEILESPIHAAKIKVIGVGGAGGNAVEHMINRKVTGIEYYCANTDAQALGLLSVTNKFQLGSKITRGLGAGADPDVGRAAALEDREQIAEILQGADMVFIAAGMGGGTGTGAAPVIAEVARDMGVLTVAVVNRPFPFEQRKRISVAEKGVLDLARHVDSLIIVPNAKLLEVLPPDTTIIKAFEAANDVLHDAVKGISDIITKPGHINVDFADVKTVMSKRGMAMMGTGIASRDDSNPGGAAARAAISSPLLENIDISSAGGILINVSGGEHLTLSDLTAVGEVTREVCDLDDDMLISGMVVDPELGDKVQVTLVATGLWGKAFQTDGLEEAGSEQSPRDEQTRDPQRPGRRPSVQGGAGAGMRQGARDQEKARDLRGKSTERQREAASAEPVALDRAKAKKAGNEGPPNLDYLDIPAFLRWNVD